MHETKLSSKISQLTHVCLAQLAGHQNRSSKVLGSIGPIPRGGSYFYRPHPKDGGRYCFQFVCQSTPRRGGGGYPSQVLMVGGGGSTPARSGWLGRGYPGQVWMVGGGVPRAPPGQVWMAYPPTMTGWGTHPPWLDGVPPPPTSIASTCCTASGMPLAFTQEDFLLVYLFFTDHIRRCLFVC